jgi:hypothetical protein
MCNKVAYVGYSLVPKRPRPQPEKKHVEIARVNFTADKAANSSL